MKGKPRPTYEEHQEYAAHLLAILDEVHILGELMSRRNSDGKYLPVTLQDQVSKIGKQANRLQDMLDAELTKLDGNDRRSDALYRPADRKGANVWYAV